MNVTQSTSFPFPLLSTFTSTSSFAVFFFDFLFPSPSLHTLLSQPLIPRQKRRSKHTTQRNPTSQVQNAIDTRGTQIRALGGDDVLRGQRGDDAEQTAPETRQSTRRASDRGGEDFGRPAVEHGVKHALHKVFQHVEPDVAGFVVDGAEDEDAGAHEARGDHHCVFAADGGDAVHEGSEEDADDAGEVDVDVAAVGEF